MNSRWLKLIRVLNSNEGPFTSSQLASILQVSSKTVRNDIKDINNLLKNYKAEIESYRGTGYKLRIDDEEMFKKFWQTYETEKPFVPTESEDRVRYIMEKLLLQPNYVKIKWKNSQMNCLSAAPLYIAT